MSTAQITGFGLLPELSGDIPRDPAAQFETLLAQQFVHAMVRGASQGPQGEDSEGGAYLGMMEGLLAKELATGQHLGIARALGMGKGEQP